jgi:glycosyltransferase involved in cell wall biosynthesis
MVKLILKRMARILIWQPLPKLKIRAIPISNIHSEPTINMVTTWGTRCGIAAYSNFLTAELKKDVKVKIVKVSGKHALSPKSFVTGFTLRKSRDLIHVQFAYGMFSDLKIANYLFNAFSALPLYFGLALGTTPVITTFHEIPKFVTPGGRLGKAFTTTLNGMVCQVSDIILVHTQESKELLIKNFKLNPAKIKVVPMGSVEAPKLQDKNKCKEKLGLLGKQVITLPGFVSRQKRHDMVVKLLPSLGENVHLLIAGGVRTPQDEAYYKEVKNLASQLNCADKISYFDDFPISPTVLNATDLAILPYSIGTDSLTLRLLAAYKVPTITSDLKMFKEVEQQYGCIETFRSGDIDDLRSKIVNLSDNKSRQEHLIKQSQVMWQNSRWSNVAAKHLDIYLEILAAHPNAVYEDAMQKERIDWLKNNVSGKSLEIGCASGYVTNYVGASVGLDLNGRRIKHAKNSYPNLDFIIASAFNLPFKEKAFDTVLIPEILEHVPLKDAKVAISEAKQIANKILITLPNAGKPDCIKALVENPEHLWFPTEELVRGLIENCKINFSSENDFILVQWN